jgi:hypothetical protein
LFFHRTYLEKLGRLPYVLTGRLAAYLQGAPIASGDRMDLAIAEDDLNDFAEWFASVDCQRWNERWLDWGFQRSDPREPGPMRWLVGLTDLRLEVGPALPAAVTVHCGEASLPVRPLHEVERTHPDIGRLMRRVRDRAGEPERA